MDEILTAIPRFVVIVKVNYVGQQVHRSRYVDIHKCIYIGSMPTYYSYNITTDIFGNIILMIFNLHTLRKLITPNKQNSRLLILANLNKVIMKNYQLNQLQNWMTHSVQHKILQHLLACA